MRAEGVFCIKKKLRTHIFFWVWIFSPNSGSKSPNSFFRKKNRNLKNTHTQRLSLENSPNSRVEFGDFPELRFKRNKIPKTCFFSKTKMSLENSPNSSAEFGEFSKLRFKRFIFLSLEKISKLKLKGWVWRFSPNSRVEFGDFLQTQVQNLQTHFFRKKKRNLKNTHTQRLSLENSPNSGSKFPNSFFSKKKTKFKKYTHSEVEFGEFSKLKGWVWRFPRTQIQKKQNPKTCLFFKDQNEFGEFSKFKCWVWRILQTQIQKIFFLSLENFPNSRVEFGEFSKLRIKRKKSQIFF